MSPNEKGRALCFYKGPLKYVSAWRGIIEPSTATHFTERERVRIGNMPPPGVGDMESPLPEKGVLLKYLGGPLGAVPYLGSQSFIEFRLVAYH